jgi:hypothetical protein
MKNRREVMKKSIVLACLAITLLPHSTYASEPLPKETVVATFTDKTFDGIYLPKNSRFSAYGDPDGTLLVARNGKREAGRTWFVNAKGQRCATDPSWKNNPAWKDGRCFDVVDAGDGKYHQFENGEHVHTLSNFRNGNQL